MVRARGQNVGDVRVVSAAVAELVEATRAVVGPEPVYGPACIGANGRGGVPKLGLEELTAGRGVAAGVEFLAGTVAG